MRVNRKYWEERESRRGGKEDGKEKGETGELKMILASWRLVEGGRSPGGAGKGVESWRNTGGEGGNLDED